MKHFMTFIDARTTLDVSSADLIALINSGEIAGKYLYPDWKISRADVEAYARDISYERDQQTHEYLRRRRHLPLVDVSFV